jgi:hypothetical protein
LHHPPSFCHRLQVGSIFPINGSRHLLSTMQHTHKQRGHFMHSMQQ